MQNATFEWIISENETDTIDNRKKPKKQIIMFTLSGH